MDVHPFVPAPDNPLVKSRNLSKRIKGLILISVCCATIVCAGLLASSTSRSFASTATADSTQLISRADDDGDVELEFGFEDWQVVIQQSALMIAGEIPYAGPVIGFFIALFWPSSQIDVWGMIKERVLQLVTQELLKQEIRDLQNDLLGLKDSLVHVKNAGIHEKGNFIDALIIVCDQIWSHIRGSSDPKHILPIFAPFAYIHLGVLNERYRCGSVLFPTDHNEAGWKSDLQTQYDTYVAWFAQTHQEWYDWRVSQLGFSCERKVGCGFRVGCTCGILAVFEDSVYGTRSEERMNCQEPNSSTFCAKMQAKNRQRVASVIAEEEKQLEYARHLNVFLPKSVPEFCAITNA